MNFNSHFVNGIPQITSAEFYMMHLNKKSKKDQILEGLNKEKN